MSLFDVIGIAGVISLLSAFYLLQTKRVAFDDYAYLCLNALGALLIIVSLVVDFNLSAFIIEVAWAAISFFGFYQRRKRDAQGRSDARGRHS
jgi:membrane-bound ClpP family serine protease